MVAKRVAGAKRPATRLRAVTDDDRPVRSRKRAAPKAKTLAEAVAGGDYLDILKAQRHEIVVSLPGEKGPAKAALHRQLSLISKEIQTLELAALTGERSVVAETADAVWDGTGY